MPSATVSIFMLTASQVFGIPIEGMDFDDLGRRRRSISASSTGFGVRLVRQLGRSPGEAKGYIDTYFEQYPGIKDWTGPRKRRTQGFVTTRAGGAMYRDQ